MAKEREAHLATWSSESQSWRLYRRASRRYSKALYHKAAASPVALLLTGFKSLLFECLKNLLGLMRPVSHLPAGANVAVYSTGNQLKSLARGADLGLVPSCRVSIYSLDRTLSAELAWISLKAAFLFPFYFANASRVSRRLVHERLVHVPRMQAVERLLARRQFSAIAISNDHHGTVFVLGTLAAWQGANVAYVQHGAVQAAFPENNFSELFLWDDRSVAIYRRLSRHPAVSICKRSDLIDGGEVDANAKDLGVLIGLSHPFPVLELITACRRLRSASLPVTLRFHPSDRLAAAKWRLLRFFNANCVMDARGRSFRDSYRRCEIAFLASSSVLLDAVEIDKHRVVWVKSFGLAWDYYKLANDIRVADTALDAVRHFQAQQAADQRQPDKGISV